MHVRYATETDVPGLLWLIQLLAECENEPNAVKIGKKELLENGFGENGYFKVILAELDDDGPTPQQQQPIGCPITNVSLPLSASMEKDERLLGYALYFFNFSTWSGKVFYLEDLFVREEYRNKGYGTALLKECAKVAEKENCARMVWQVLDWNTKAMELYERVGGEYVKEWLTIRMYRPNMLRFAST